MAATVIVKCKCCKTEFTARVADRKRGWAKFCSKSCKAKKQEARTGQYAAYKQGESNFRGSGVNRPMIGIDYGRTPDMTVGLLGHMNSAGVLHIKEEAIGSDAVAELELKYRRRLDLMRRLKAGLVSFRWPK
jgi:hypothetical protein